MVPTQKEKLGTLAKRTVEVSDSKEVKITAADEQGEP